jgi:hypothetical protein
MSKAPDFEHYVEATRQVVEEFRDDVLAPHMAKMTKADTNLHRLRVASDNFVNALNGQYSLFGGLQPNFPDRESESRV